MRTRPLVVAKIEEFVRSKECKISSGRLVDELFTFVYHNNKAEALRGYNDDLVMAYGIGLWVRDTALRLKAEGIELNKRTLENFKSNQAIYTQKDNENDSWDWNVGNENESLNWLLDKNK